MQRVRVRTANTRAIRRPVVKYPRASRSFPFPLEKPNRTLPPMPHIMPKPKKVL